MSKFYSISPFLIITLWWWWCWWWSAMMVEVQGIKWPTGISAELARSVCVQQKKFAENPSNIQPPLKTRPKSSPGTGAVLCGWHKFGNCGQHRQKNCKYISFEACPQPRVINGVPVSPKYKYPFMASLSTRSGTTDPGPWFLTFMYWQHPDERLLTAAHCVNHRTNDESVRVTVGEHDRKIVEGMEQIVQSDLVIVHVDYDDKDYIHDIALVRVNPAIKFNAYVQPVSLPPSPSFVAEGTAISIGWGLTSEAPGSKPNYVPNEANVTIITDSVCKSLYEGRETVVPSHICIYTPGVGVCDGDSGGPLVIKEGTSFTQVGVGSWTARTCAGEGNPGVFTEVTHHLKWIQDLLVAQ